MNHRFINIGLKLNELVTGKLPLPANLKFTNEPKRGDIVRLYSESIQLPQFHRRHSTMFNIRKSQRKLCEITDLIYEAQFYHKRINVGTESMDENITETYVNNYLCIRFGDINMAKFFGKLAELRNPTVFKWMLDACNDFCESNFERKNDFDLERIKDGCYGCDGSLLAYSFKSVTLLGGFSDNNQNFLLNNAFEIGKSIGMILKVNEMIHSMQNLKSISNQKHFDYLKQLLNENENIFIRSFDRLPKSDAKQKLINLINCNRNYDK